MFIHTILRIFKYIVAPQIGTANNFKWKNLCLQALADNSPLSNTMYIEYLATIVAKTHWLYTRTITLIDFENSEPR